MWILVLISLVNGTVLQTTNMGPNSMGCEKYRLQAESLYRSTHPGEEIRSECRNEQ
jgi:hypothetical protein